MRGKKYVFIIVGLSLAGGLYAIVYEQLQKNMVATLPKKYVSDGDTTRKTIVLFIRNLKYKKRYLQYVEDELKEVEEIPVNFPTENVLPKGEPIYIRKYLSDSSLVEFYSPTYHRRIWGFTTGYIHRAFLFDTLFRR